MSTKDTYNFQSQTAFEFKIAKLSNVSFYCQNVTLPQVSFGQADVQYPGFTAKFPGDAIDYSELVIDFIVDEDMKNYKELYDWIRSLLPNTWNNSTAPASKQYGQNELYSPATLLPMTASSSNITRTITFDDLFPTSIGSLTFRTNSNTMEYNTVSATFAFTKFDIR